jgi:hypothetical protein
VSQITIWREQPLLSRADSKRVDISEQKLTPDDYERLGLGLTPKQPDKRWAAKLVMCGAMVTLLGWGASACARAIDKSWGENISETSSARYVELVKGTLMPAAIPAEATDVRFSYNAWTGIHGYRNISLSAKLPASEIANLLADARYRGRPYPPAKIPYNYSSARFIGEKTLSADDWNGLQQFDFAADPDLYRRFEGIAINPRTSRVVWISHVDGG